MKIASLHDDDVASILRSLGRSDIKPSWVLGYLYLEHGTLDSISQSEMRRLVKDIIIDVDADPEQAKQLARSQGLQASEMNDIKAARELMAAARLIS